MDAHPLYGKRKKEVDPCPNPLFIQWVVEWKDDAAAKGLKTQYTYAKALRSLMKYPLPLESGKECKMLEFFGDKLCQMLDDKLNDYVAEYGTTDPVPGYITVAAAKPKVKKPRKSPARKRAVNASVGSATHTYGSASACISLDSGSSDEERPALAPAPAPAPPPQRRPSGGGGKKRGEYMPAYRSGPYALILALHYDLQNAGSRGFMTKTELMKEAQPMADKSFRVPDPGSRYTAWSSMGSLITKGFIIKESSPAKYQLTDQGKELALKILENYEDNITGCGASNVNIDLGFVIGRQNPLVNDNWDAPPPLPVLHRQPAPENSGGHQLISAGHQSGYKTTNDINKNPVTGIIKTSNMCNTETIDLSMEDDSDTDSLLARYNAVGMNDDDDILPDLPSVEPLQTNYPGQQSSQEALPSLRDRIMNQSSKSTLVWKQDSPPSVQSSASSHSAHGLPEVSGLKFWYVGEDGGNVRAKDQAVVTVDEEISIGFLIRCEHIDLIMCGKKYKLDNTRSRVGKDVFAYIADGDAPEFCSLASVPAAPSVGKPSHPSAAGTYPPQGRVGKPLQSTSSSTHVMPSAPKKTVSQPARPPTTQMGGKAADKPALQRSMSDKPTLSRVPSTSSWSSSQDSQMSTGSTTSTLPEPDFILEPGTFEIVLIVDKCEHFGGSEKSSKAILIPELKKNCVQFDIRNLSIGDFAWIAKPKNSFVGGKKNESQELVLDHVVERKRMDDLVGSIMDGRFREQKFRLRNCGARQPIYLVEDHGSCQHFSIAEDTLKQAIINTQVIDGFYVKRTKDMRDSISYLTVMTRYMQSAYSNKRLIACSKSGLQDADFKNDIRSREQRLITYQEFNQASVKSKALTVREMLGKQLVQLHGITVEKVLSVLNEYPTPNSLFKAYDECYTEKQREALLSEIKFGPLKKKLGPAVSKQVSMVYCPTSVSM